jgi:hypothetical protein
VKPLNPLGLFGQPYGGGQKLEPQSPPPYGMTPEEYKNAGFFDIMAAATSDGIRKGKQANETARQNTEAGLATMTPRKGMRGTQSGTAPAEWGDTAGGFGDAYYLRKEPLQELFGETVGDQIYRNQGVALHGALGLAALPFGPALAAPNLGYAAYSYLTGRTNPRPTGFWEPVDEKTFMDVGARPQDNSETYTDPAIIEYLRLMSARQ